MYIISLLVISNIKICKRNFISDMSELSREQILEANKGYVDTTNALFTLHTYDSDKISKLCGNIKYYLIDRGSLTASHILRLISCASKLNCKYAKSYWAIFQTIYHDYQPKGAKGIYPIYNYLAYKEYGIRLDKDPYHKFWDFKSIKPIIEVHEENTLYCAIMDDDIRRVTEIAEADGFDDKQKMENPFYEFLEGYDLLTMCSYHGSVQCFKYFRSKFHAEITPECFYIAFLRGQPDIVKDCLENFHKKVPFLSINFAVKAHNNKAIPFLREKYKFDIDAEDAAMYANLEAFLEGVELYLDDSEQKSFFFVCSPLFGLPSVVEYVLAKGVDINAICYDGKTALHSAAQCNNTEIVEFLIAHGANLNALTKVVNKGDTGQTPLDVAIEYGNEEVKQILKAHGGKKAVDCRI